MYVFNTQCDAQDAECHINVCAHMLPLMQGHLLVNSCFLHISMGISFWCQRVKTESKSG